MSYITFANMVYFIMMILLCVARLVINFGWLNLDELALEVAFSVFVQIGVFGLVPLTLVTKFKKQGISKTFKDFKFNKLSIKHVIMSFALGILVTIFNLCVANLFSALLTLVGYETTSSGLSIDPSLKNFLIVVLYSAVLPAIFEEKLFGLHLGTSPSVGISNGNWWYLIIVLLVAVTTYFSFKNNKNTMSGDQAKQMNMMFNIMVVMIFITSFSMSTAIIIYWVINSLLTIIQNSIVKRSK